MALRVKKTYDVHIACEKKINAHYRSEGRRRGSGAVFLAESENLKYEKLLFLSKRALL